MPYLRYHVHSRNPLLSEIINFKPSSTFSRNFISLSKVKECSLPPPPRKQRRYFDLKTFRQHVKRLKNFKADEEKKNIAKAYCKKPPEGWDILKFLSEINIGENAEEISKMFLNWTDFATSTVEDLQKKEIMTNSQRRQLWKYLTLFHHDLWPSNSYDQLLQKFQADPLKNEGKIWTDEDDANLLRLASLYDVNFGDPWIYISWEMQREIDDVQNRYLEIVTIPQNRGSFCELAMTKSTRPLLMSRYFKLLCPILFIVPSQLNFPLKPTHFKLPTKFQKYRRQECFENHPDEE